MPDESIIDLDGAAVALEGDVGDYESLAQAAKRMQISRDALRKRIARDGVPGAVKVAGAWLVPASFGRSDCEGRGRCYWGATAPVQAHPLESDRERALAEEMRAAIVRLDLAIARIDHQAQDRDRVATLPARAVMLPAPPLRGHSRRPEVEDKPAGLLRRAWAWLAGEPHIG
jgi:hypothetical protein